MAAKFLKLPTELLRKVGEFSSSAFVVALSYRDGAAIRLAAGVDETERAYCGLGLTVREAELSLRRHDGFGDGALTSRSSVARALMQVMFHISNVNQTDQLEITPELRDLFRWAIAYGMAADTRYETYTLLHVIAASGDAGSIEIAGWLLEAGADVNAKCMAFNMAGRHALSWAISLSDGGGYSLESKRQCHAMALFLVQHGADVAEAKSDYASANPFNSTAQLSRPGLWQMLTLQLSRARTDSAAPAADRDAAIRQLEILIAELEATPAADPAA